MIANDKEFKGTRARIAYFEDLLAQMQVAARPELFPSMASGYRAEIETMQREVLAAEPGGPTHDVGEGGMNG